MTAIDKRLYDIILPRLFKKLSPERIPRSGEAGQKMNCFSVFVDDEEGKSHFVAQKFEGIRLIGKRWNGNFTAIDAEIDLAEINPQRFRVVHYYGLNEVTYRGIRDVARTWLLPTIYLKIHCDRILDRITQYFFNKRSLQGIERLRLLRLMVDWHIENGQPLSSIDVMTQTNTLRWVLHPQRDAQQKKIELYFDSLVDSGELTKQGYRYMVTGRAIGTIERFEEEERRHTENARIQWAMLALTFFIALLTIVQAGLVKLPTFIDWSR